MKIFISILDLNTHHEYEKTHVDVWSSQERKIHTLEREKNGIILNANIDHQIPLGIVFGVYGTLNNNIVHCVGFCMFDVSKIKPNTNNTITGKITDNTSPSPTTGMIQVSIKWNSLLTIPSIPMNCILNTLHDAAESNLNLIKPYSPNGLDPITPILNRIHSPYYTSNMGMHLPSGAFLLDCGTQYPGPESIESHLDRLKTALKCTGNTRDYFISHVENIENTEYMLDIEYLSLVLYKTLTMHAVQCIRYVSDVQFDKNNNEIGTDRWECPRYDNNSFVGDCEDCSKEIFVEIEEWNRMQSDEPLVLSMQKLLSYYVPVVVQGCVNISGTYKNHIWAALISKYEFKENLNTNIPMDTCDFKLPTLLLEGTGSTYPMFMDKKRRKETKRNVKRIKKTYIRNMCETDMTPFGFYKYVVACMTPTWKKRGILDFVYINNENKYGIPFKDWWRGKYKMSPACIHPKKTIQLIEHVISYDKPIMPLTYRTKIISSFGTVECKSTRNIVFGYRINSLKDKHHMKIINTIKKMNKTSKYNIYGNVIDHETCMWSEWVITQHESPGLLILN